ncbi:DUF2249 domain-containing protein [Hydrogenophaga sp. PAMC20947]|uniref:DUF2249 domain-containing protein n=1 Tax=Hydrogenophaga sp. PAMC20947 TaxID=2565558 RepID=UPI00109DCBA8|nr:DUF2249 domain-containing protein [Hydrogenophaga sp. PAMC20947]QCB48503.1 DUF2249 domain-containing protein [Hydrogenophaga sp. PAMC20947]
MNTTTALAPTTVDLRTIAPRERHTLVFSTFKALLPGESMELINDHSPQPLLGQFESGLFGAFNWNPLESGPEQWRVQIAKPAESKPVHGVNSCCGSCGG